MHFVIACLFLCPFLFFILTLLLYFCLLVNHLNKPIIFVFGAFVDYFKNAFSIFVTIYIFQIQTPKEVPAKGPQPQPTKGWAVTEEVLDSLQLLLIAT